MTGTVKPASEAVGSVAAVTDFDKLKALLNAPWEMKNTDCQNAVRLIGKCSAQKISGTSTSTIPITPQELLTIAQHFKAVSEDTNTKTTALIEFVYGAMQEKLRALGIALTNVPPMRLVSLAEPCGQLLLNGRTFDIRPYHHKQSNTGNPIFSLQKLKTPPKLLGTWLHHNGDKLDVELLGFRFNQVTDGIILNQFEGRITDENTRKLKWRRLLGQVYKQ
jgi:hypothetical protein